MSNSKHHNSGYDGDIKNYNLQKRERKHSKHLHKTRIPFTYRKRSSKLLLVFRMNSVKLAISLVIFASDMSKSNTFVI